MTLVKHGARTVRKPCHRCGRMDDLYWAHDTDRPVRDTCDRCKANGAYTLIERDGSKHECSHTDRKGGGGGTPAPEGAEQQPATEGGTEGAEGDAKPVKGKPEGDGKDGAKSPVEAALEQLMDALTPQTPGVDEDTLRKIVREEVDKTAFPTIVTIKRPDKPDFKIEGMTHRKLPKVIAALQVGEHVLMVGPAGTGKSTIAEQAAEALNLPAYSLSLTPQTSHASVFGYMQATGQYVSTLFRQAYEGGGVFNFDEMDNGHPSILAGINGSLANGHAAFPDGMITRHPDFRVVGSANTYGRGADRKYVGRQQLDAATLDRFTFLDIEIDEALEAALCYATGVGKPAADQVLTFVREVRGKAVETALPVVISPRASVGMCRLLLAGYTVPEAVDARVRRGLSDQDWRKISATPKITAKIGA